MTEKKMRINIWDMPRDVKISRGEMTHLHGGNYLSSPYSSSYASYSRISDLVSLTWRGPISPRPIDPRKAFLK